jgi:hypothetical protein
MEVVNLIKMFLIKFIGNPYKNHLSHNFPIQICLTQKDGSVPPLLNFTLEYALKKVHGSHAGLKLNGTYQLLDSGVNVNLLRNNINTKKKKQILETLIDASKVGLEVNAEKTWYMLLSPYQYAWQSHYMNSAYVTFQNVIEFKYLGTTNK